jgi:hypothetical protein
VIWGNWATVADLATALGTLVLAVATFSAVKSANLTARAAQQSLLVGLRPVLMVARRDDPAQKVNFGDEKWIRIPGGGAVGEVGAGKAGPGKAGAEKGLTAPDAPVYLALALRNAGSGIAVMHGWRFYPEWHRDNTHAPVEEFERQNRDLYIPAGDIGFWQGTFRDPGDPRYEQARKVIEARQPWTVELLYGDHEGGQRCVTRFTMLPRTAKDPDADPAAELGWFASQSRHWNIDRPDPRQNPVAACDFGNPASHGEARSIR